MVLLALALAAPTPGLPAWTYTYELPDRPTALVDGVLRPISGVTGTPPEAPPPGTPLPALRLADLVPGVAKESGFEIGGRLDRAFVARATRPNGTSMFQITEAGATIGYSLNESNRIRAVFYSTPLTEAESEARFAAIRTRMDARLGAPSYGGRTDDVSLTLVWQRADRSYASLGLINEDGKLGMAVILTDREIWNVPVPKDGR